MDRAAQRLATRIRAAVRDPGALGEIVRDWPELAGWWPGVGDPDKPPVDGHLGHPAVVAAIRRCEADAQRRRRYEEALHRRERGRPPKLRLARAIAHAVAAVRARDNCSSAAAHERVSQEFSALVAEWGSLYRNQRILLDQPDASQTIPAHLLPLLRVTAAEPPPTLVAFLDEVARIPEPDVRDAVESGLRVFPTRAVRELDEMYRARLRVLQQLGLRRFGTVVRLQGEGGPLLTPGPGITVDGQAETADVATDIDAVARWDGESRKATGHRCRPDKQRVTPGTARRRR